MRLKEWQILKSGNKSDFAIITAITIIFLFVIGMNVKLIYQMTSNQAEEIGQTQLEVIKNDFQKIIYQAEGLTTKLAMETEQLLVVNTPLNELETFFHKRKREQKNSTSGVCFNTYVANKQFSIIPDFDMPPDYHATERLWYIGAVENPGKTYITEPYIDAMTGIMCFTISKMLGDGQTVVASDFTFSDIQYFIRKMSNTSGRKALIVTKSGIIIGYTDMSLVGERVSSKLPDYEKVLNRIVESGRNESFTAQLNGNEHMIFSTATTNGWYIILSVDNWAFYKESYMQIAFTMLISLLMMIAIIFFYLNAMKNGLLAKNALQVKEDFLSRLSHELRDPVKNILNLSSVETIKSDADPLENAVKVRESALRLSDMLDNLFSFSTIVSSDKNALIKQKEFRDKELSQVSRYAKAGITTVLISAMIFAFGICFSTTTSWGDTKMNREIDTYDNQLSNWIENQRAILSMFVNLLKEHPELMDDYPKAVKFLDDLAKHYPEISVCYLANPHKEHSLIMNNGWTSPDPNWRVELRPWYTSAEKSVSGFSISAPYYDAQTGLYCITMSQLVFGSKGEFVGVFGIDFYIDRLIQVLGRSYSKDSYAFMVDSDGTIINHPNENYQLSRDKITDIASTEYADAYLDSDIDTFRDYTGNFVACLAKKNRLSNFKVVVANDWWNIYGNNILLGGFFVILLVICIFIVNNLINRLIRWQESVNRQLKSNF